MVFWSEAVPGASTPEVHSFELLRKYFLDEKVLGVKGFRTDPEAPHGDFFL